MDELIDRDSPETQKIFCLRCQESLVRGSARCSTCGLPFDPTDAATYTTERFRMVWVLLMPGLILAVVSGSISYALIAASETMGTALFVALPISIGALIGYLSRVRIWFKIMALLIAIGAILLVLVSANIGGVFCAMVGGAILLAPAAIGLGLGAGLRVWLKGSEWSQRVFLPVFFFLTLPYLTLAVERLFPPSEAIVTVATSTVFDVEPEAAWKRAVFYEEVTHEPPFLLKLALPRPRYVIGTKMEAGSVVRCVYERGHLTKRISEVNPGRRLAFEVIDQQLHFERDVRLLDGRFEFTPLSGKRTRVTLLTRYQRLLSPEFVWRPIEERVVRTLHQHVLRGMRECDGDENAGTRSLVRGAGASESQR